MVLAVRGVCLQREKAALAAFSISLKVRKQTTSFSFLIFSCCRLFSSQPFSQVLSSRESLRRPSFRRSSSWQPISSLQQVSLQQVFSWQLFLLLVSFCRRHRLRRFCAQEERLPELQLRRRTPLRHRRFQRRWILLLPRHNPLRLNCYRSRRLRRILRPYRPHVLP